ncbi:UPF0481 protein At3g47200-like isoform X1 [Lycium ferocissimum]|uniref:UPF0481 protein At3g47200-like isoform X1 n=1 Tax=Lycium ferocissimum TaxID=112874 RepID=UPI0028159603|nr:UPF0481 protein At3g47200-like isoform X1 [Lycium ferocissimum]
MKINSVNIDEVVLQDLCKPRSSSGGRKIQKVPSCLRDENKDHLYVPKIVSFGPYHHGNPKFQITEEYKYKVMHRLIPGDDDVVNIYNSFLVSIKEIRDCYVEGSTDRYSDAELARMLLLDACLLLSFMLDIRSAVSALDLATIYAIIDDILLLENQIPLWILKRLATSIFGDGNIIAQDINYSSWKELLGKFCKKLVFSVFEEAIIELGSSDDDCLYLCDDDCLHLLQLFREVYVSGYDTGRRNALPPSTCFQKYFRCARVSKNQREVDGINSFESVRDLKSKGILCKPSSLKTLTGIKFKSHYLFAQLELPPLRIDTISMVTYANMIAYEMSIDTSAMAIDFQITNYINFMKSLIISAEDVKELREQGILFNGLGTDKEVVKVLQEIPAGPLISFGSFLDVKREIQHHTSSKKGIFLAELFSTHFSSPWSIMTLLVVIVLLGLTLA